MSLLLCGSCTGCRSEREYSTSCACLCTRCSSGTLPITLPACWCPPLTFLHGRRCVHRVGLTVTWSYQERVGRLVTGLYLLPHPVLGIDFRPTWNSCVRLLHSRTNCRVLCFMCLHREHCELLECAIGLIVGGALKSLLLLFLPISFGWVMNDESWRCFKRRRWSQLVSNEASARAIQAIRRWK